VFGKQSTDVLVVGAGPVGLITAWRLTSQGVKVQIVDKHQRTGVHSYALALHPRSLRLLDELGLTAKLIEQGHRVDRVTFMQNDEPQASLALSELDEPFPFVLVLPQRKLESALEEHLQNNHIKVQWNHRVQTIDEHPSELRSEIARLDQAPSGYPIARLEWVVDKILNTRSAFVVGADGYHSFTRGLLGFEYRQVAAEQTFAVFEFECSTDPGHELRICLHEGRTSVMWPMGRNRCRWSFQIDDEQQHEPTLERLNGLIRDRAPWFPEARGEIHWTSPVQFDRRLTDCYGRDRIWLAGDAAHLTSPVGVQSLNVGLLEGWELGGLLAGQLRGEGSAGDLDQYNTERLKEWGTLLGLSGGLESTSEASEWVKQHASEILPSVPATGEDLARLLRQIGLTYDPTAG